MPKRKIKDERKKRKNVNKRSKQTKRKEVTIEPLTGEWWIPDEIILIILKHLPEKDRTRLARISKQFLRLSNDELFYKNLYDDIAHDPRKTKQIKELIYEETQSYRKTILTISCDVCSVCSTLKGDILGIVMESFRLCSECRSLPPFQLITKTRAKSEYLLNDKDILDLECYVMLNPHYRSGPPMSLYLTRSITNICHKKHGGEEGYQKAKQKSEERKRKLKVTKERKKQETKELLEKSREERQSILADNLQNVGMQLLRRLSEPSNHV